MGSAHSVSLVSPLFLVFLLPTAIFHVRKFDLVHQTMTGVTMIAEMLAKLFGFMYTVTGRLLFLIMVRPCMCVVYCVFCMRACASDDGPGFCSSYSSTRLLRPLVTNFRCHDSLEQTLTDPSLFASDWIFVCEFRNKWRIRGRFHRSRYCNV